MLSKNQIVQLSGPTTKKIIQGVYFLVYKGDIVYVGSAFDVYSRLKIHKQGRFIFNKWFYIEFNDKEKRLETEYKYIRKFKPLYNFKHNPDFENGKKEILRTFLKQWDSVSEVSEFCGLSGHLINDVVYERMNYATEYHRKIIIDAIMSRYIPLKNPFVGTTKQSLKYISSRTL